VAQPFILFVKGIRRPEGLGPCKQVAGRTGMAAQRRARCMWWHLLGTDGGGHSCFNGTVECCWQPVEAQSLGDKQQP
jgi:hypothetical protein